MINRVDFIEDFVEPYAIILQGAYEKANIWPESDFKVDILREELDEVQESYEELKWQIEEFNSFRFPEVIFQPEKVQETQGYILSLMCELVQIIAVLNKYKGDE